MPTVSVEPVDAGYQTIEQKESEGISWHMVFKITADDGVKCTFTWWEPYIMTLKKWQRMADGHAIYYNSYGGNGDGGIEITSDGFVNFGAMPSGSGGDVTCEFGLPHGLIKQPLSDAIAKARALRYQFAKK
jgi:hypothetical protein